MEILQNTFLGNSIAHWLIALAWGVGGVIVARILYKIIGSIARKITAKTRSNLDNLIVDKLEAPFGVAPCAMAWKARNFASLLPSWCEFCSRILLPRPAF